MLRNITLSAEESWIEAARKRAREEDTTLNHLFRKWLQEYSARKSESAARVAAHRNLVKRMKHFKVGRKLTREEMNAR